MQKVLQNTQYIALILSKLKDHPLLVNFLCDFEQIFRGSFENRNKIKGVMDGKFSKDCHNIVRDTASRILADEE